MPTARWRLILNGKSEDDARVRDAVAEMRARNIEIEVSVTHEHADAARAVAVAVADGVDTVIAAGGDGTLSAVAAALAGCEGKADELPALGLLPLGTANDFAAAANLPEDPFAALELARVQPARAIDLLCFDADGDAHWAINLASGGFGPQVTLDTGEGMKQVLGGVAYLITAMSKLGRIERTAARIEGPEFAWEGEFIALGIGNGRMAGGGQALCPDALIDDGLIDLTVVPEMSGEVVATLGTLIGDGKQAALARVATFARLPWIEVTAPQPFTLNRDGEPVRARRFRIECVPRRLRMHLSEDCPLLTPHRVGAT